MFTFPPLDFFGIIILVHSTLVSIDKYTRKQVSRNFFLRMTFAKGDVGRVQEYRERLRQSLDVFWVRPSLPKFNFANYDIFVKLQSSIRVRDNLSQIAKQQGAMYQALQDRRSGDGVDSRPSAEGRLEVLSATQYNRDSFNNNVGSHNSTQMTSKIIQSITSATIIHISVFVSYSPPCCQVELEVTEDLDFMGELAGQVETSR